MLVRLTQSTLLRATTAVALAGSLTARTGAVQPVRMARDVIAPALALDVPVGGAVGAN